MPRILFVSGFHPATRARDLAFEFERYALPPFSLGDTFRLTDGLLSQLRPSNSLRCPRPSQSFCTLKSVCTFLPLFLPALPLQRHECLLRRTLARRLRTRTHARFFSFRFERRRLSAPFDLASSPNESSTSLDCRSYAFVEFRSTRDAEDAYYDMYASVIPLPCLFTPHPRFLFFSGTDACLRVHA